MKLQTHEEKQTAREQRSLITLKESLESLYQVEHDLSFTSDYINSINLNVALDNVIKAIGSIQTEIQNIEGVKDV